MIGCGMACQKLTDVMLAQAGDAHNQQRTPAWHRRLQLTGRVLVIRMGLLTQEKSTDFLALPWCLDMNIGHQ